MKKKIDWAPRYNMVIVECRLKAEEKNRKVLNIDSDGAHFVDSYDLFVYDKGWGVAEDLEPGDQIYCNYANLKFIHGTTDRKQDITYMMVIDSLIDLRQPGPQTI